MNPWDWPISTVRNVTVALVFYLPLQRGVHRQWWHLRGFRIVGRGQMAQPKSAITTQPSCRRLPGLLGRSRIAITCSMASSQNCWQGMNEVPSREVGESLVQNQVLYRSPHPIGYEATRP